jgi:hypothetical protein
MARTAPPAEPGPSSLNGRLPPAPPALSVPLAPLVTSVPPVVASAVTGSAAARVPLASAVPSAPAPTGTAPTLVPVPPAVPASDIPALADAIVRELFPGPTSADVAHAPSPGAVVAAEQQTDRVPEPPTTRRRGLRRR